MSLNYNNLECSIGDENKISRTRSWVDVFVREIKMRMKKTLDYQENMSFTKALGK